jgi:GTP1/Obg family GTP-binding protein
MLSNRHVLALAVMALFLTFTALPAVAQDAQPVKDAELEKTAEAYTNIMTINNEFQQTVQETEDPAEIQQLQKAANEKMIDAVETAGLDVDTYNNVMRQVHADEALMNKFTQLMERM